MEKNMEQVIYTVTANCHDCYRCVRVCPVKAIRVSEGQARIDDSLCIKCGTCIRECPQHAKRVISSVEKVKKIIAAGHNVAVSMAPSFPAAFHRTLHKKLPTALKKLGFSYISETAEGAKVVATESFSKEDNGIICTACPAVVNYVEKYRPQFIDKLIPVTSPMIAHGRLLKQRLGKDTKVVFIGPCAAKKEEIYRPDNADAVDEVLTFTELIEWFEDEEMDLSKLPDGQFDSYGELGMARLFPLQGGMLKTGNIACDVINAEILDVSGPDSVKEVFDIPPQEWTYSVAEPLFCAGGCINGPGFPIDTNKFARKQAVLQYAYENADQNRQEQKNIVPCEVSFVMQSNEIIDERIPEHLILEILNRTGKGNPEMQLNCGACGYNTCRDKAIAVAKGMAEAEMCLPYMRRLAQQHTNKIVENSPNGIVILDDELKIINMNKAFQDMFLCTNAVMGKRISYLIDADSFEKLVTGTVDEHESIRNKYGIKYHEVVYALRDEKQYIGIFANISKVRFDSGEMNLIKNQTLENARELLEHQINFSQQMAHYLGKSTAQSEELVKRLMDLYSEEELQ